MKYLLVMLFLIFLTGCIEENKWQVSCDSGYKTPISVYTRINDDIIIYRENKTVERKQGYRKIIPGEVCIDKKVMP